jgi:glycosyltransferase involved in cell wall biosynthesis
VAPTRFVGDRAVEWGIPADRVSVRALGAVAGPTRARSEGARRRMGYIGGIAPHKGVHVLVEAFRRVADPGITLDVHGSLSVAPAYVERLRAAAAGDPRIRFHGGFPEGAQARILSGLDLVIVPSVWWENSPLVVLEALAEGVPVVASAIGGLPEIVPEGAGLLVPPADVDALSLALGAAAAGRVLAEALPPLALKTIDEGARELLGVYGPLFGSSKGEPLFESSKGRPLFESSKGKRAAS